MQINQTKRKMQGQQTTKVMQTQATLVQRKYNLKQ